MSRQKSIIAALAIGCSAVPAHAGFYIEQINLPLQGLPSIVFTEPHSAAATHSYRGNIGDSAVSVTFSSDPAPYIYATASTAYDPNSYAEARVRASLNYSFDVIGAPGTFVPVLFKGRLEIHNDSYLPYTTASAQFSADGAGSRTGFLAAEQVTLFTTCNGNFTNGVPCYSETSRGDPSQGFGSVSSVSLTLSPVVTDLDGGTTVRGIFQGVLNVPVNFLGNGTGSILLGVEVFAMSSLTDLKTNSILSWAFIDPELRIDPQYLANHPGAALALPAGVGAELLAGPVPETSTLAMMLSGLGLAGLAAARRRKARR